MMVFRAATVFAGLAQGFQQGFVVDGAHHAAGTEFEQKAGDGVAGGSDFEHPAAFHHAIEKEQPRQLLGETRTFAVKISLVQKRLRRRALAHLGACRHDEVLVRTPNMQENGR